MASTFDIAFGVDSASFTAAVKQLYDKQGPREKFFKGTYTEDDKSGDWDVLEAPVFDFSAPDATRWADSLNGDGQSPGGQPPGDGFQLKIAKFKLVYGSLTIDDAQVEVYLTAVVADSKLTITPNAIWYDKDKFSKADEFFIKNLVVKEVFARAKTLLAGITVPALERKIGDIDLELTVQDATINAAHLIVSAVGKDSTPAATPTNWPEAPVFLLVAPGFRDAILSKVADKIKSEKPDPYKIDNSGATGQADWSITDITNIKPAGENTAKFTADIAYTFSAFLTVEAAGSSCALSKGANSA
jgi:hypothetical protein